MNYPPFPRNISIPAVVAGNILQNDDTSVSVIEDGYKGSIIMKTDNKLGMLITPDQKVSINSQSIDSMLTINNDVEYTSTLRLSYRDSFYFDTRVTPNGNVLCIPNCDDTQLNPFLTTTFLKNFDIIDHDGVRIGFRLGGTLITASASELNYVDVRVGTGRANKALVLDESLNIDGINMISASQINGTLLTGNQPNITSLNNVNIMGEFKINGVTLDINPQILRYIKMPNEGVAYPSKAMILDANKNYTGINNLAAQSITGILTEGPQPNITSLRALTSLVNIGPSQLAKVIIKTDGDDQLIIANNDTMFSKINTTPLGNMVLKSVGEKIYIDASCDFHIPSHDGSSSGLVLGTSLVTSTAQQLNFTDVTPGLAAPNKAVVLDLSGNVSGINQVVANLLAGTVQTPNQPFISSVSTLNISTHTGTRGLSLNGTLITASADQINSVDVVAGTAGSNKAMVLNNLKSITGVNSLSANTIAGVLTTNEQPNITSVNSLNVANHNGITGLRLGGTLVVSTANQLNRLALVSGTANPDKALVVDGSCNIVGINNLSASNLTGTIQTTTQPNINQVNTLDIATHDGRTIGLSLNGRLITSTAEQLNRVNVIAGTADGNKALVLDSSFSVSGINILNANIIGGILSSPNQLNIRKLNSIDVVDHNGTNTGLSLNGILVVSSAYQLNYLAVQQGVGTAGKALVLDSVRDINNINSLTATNIHGIIQTAAQPMITRVSTLNIMNHNGTSSGLSLNGILVTANADQINTLVVSAGRAVGGKALIVDNARNITNINQLSATMFEGTLATSFQPNLTSVNTLNITTTNGLSLAGVAITATAAQINTINTVAGTASQGKALIVDNSLNISGINSLTASSFTGIIQTANQPKIAFVDTLDITKHDGGSVGLRLNGVLVNATATQLNYNTVVPGSATSLRSLVTDVFNSISGINAITATRITSERLTLSGVISNFNTGALVMKSYSSTDIIGRMINIQLLQTSNFANFQPANLTSGYSCEIIGYIRPEYSETFTFYITCNDRVRLWVNGELLLHSWVGSSTTRISSTIFLNAEQWVPIYIQYQVDVGNTSFFQLEWASFNVAKGQIPSSRLAWDNNTPAVSSKHFTQNSLTIYNTLTASANTAKLSVDSGGDLIIDASGNDIATGASDSFNIPSHNGSRGLYLGGVLVEPTAYELNYLKVNPGIALPSHALVVDSSKSITGVNSITASSISCNNLSANAFTISNLSLNGALNNYNAGELLIRQITGPDVGGRVVDVNTIRDINLNGYDPRQIGSYYSLDISGYILPKFTELHRFHAIANDRVRIWVGGVLILNVWDLSSGTEHTSSQVSLTAGQWVPIYIQFQNIDGTASLQVRWSSQSLIKSFLDSQSMAWDNTVSSPPRVVSSPDQLTVFSSVSGLTSVQSGNINVDGNGIMRLSSTSGVVSIATSTNLNIASHNGTTGLQLSGVLVTATANEINYLSGVNPGSVVASKAIVLDSNKSLTGLGTISSNIISGTILTPAQPNITSVGTLSSTLNSTSDIVITSTNALRLSADSNTCYIQAGSSNAANASADLFIGNYGVSTVLSNRKFMIKASGFVGIQTLAPQRALSINGSGATYCMRLIQNSSAGADPAFCDIGVDTSSNLRIGSNLIIGSSGTASISVNSSGIMNITPSGGSIQIGNSANSIMPLEVGSSLFTISSSTGYINSEGSAGITVPTATAYSIRTTSSIIVNGTVCITSDRRLKQQVQTLSTERCREFIMSSRSVQFNYIDDPLKARRCGLIAQDIAKSTYPELVKMAPYIGLNEEIDSEGYVSPKDAAFNVSYEEIIPILMTTVKEVITENDTLRNQLKQVETKLKDMEDMIQRFMNGNNQTN